MFPNLNAELKRYNVSVKNLASLWGVSETTVYKKLKGNAPIKLKEIQAVKDNYCPDKTIDYLIVERSEQHATS